MPFEQFDAVYLDVPDALDAYAEAIQCDRDTAAKQVRWEEGLASALDRPRTYAYYGSASIALQAAALAHGMVEDHPFHDGNKRTAAVVLEQFLVLNGFELTASDEDLVSWMLGLSKGLTPETFATIIQAFLSPVLD